MLVILVLQEDLFILMSTQVDFSSPGLPWNTLFKFLNFKNIYITQHIPVWLVSQADNLTNTANP